MQLRSWARFMRVAAIGSCAALTSTIAVAADLTPAPAPQPTVVPEIPSGWTFRFIPYAWLVGLSGNSTVKGRTADVDLPFTKIVEETIGKGGTLLALMGDLEVRYGPLGIYTDAVLSKMTTSGDSIRARRLAPGVTGTLATSSGFTLKEAIVESGVAYEVARFTMPHGDSPGIPAAIDLVAGARYWYQQADLSFNISANLDIADLTIGSRNRAIAKSGSVDWVDPLVGARVRFEIAPGQTIFAQGDVGGFGAGSKISWQTIGGYSFDFAQKNGITYSGIIGFRALYVDYTQGFGTTRYGFNMLQYGPVLGLSMRF